jgi:crotonobetaine/carnitine-CoA ligase
LRSDTVGGLLHGQASVTPDVPFLWTDGTWMSYAETAGRSDKLAAGLQSLGVGPGDRVAVVLPNEQAAVLAVFACARLGAIQVPLNTFLRGEFLRHQLADCSASVVITDAPGLDQIRRMESVLPDLTAVILVGEGDTSPSEYFELIRYADVLAASHQPAFPEVKGTDLFSILYTSGTSGLPKGCLISHRYAANIGKTLGEVGRFEAADRVLTASPLFHTSGQIFAMVSVLHQSGSIAFEREFHASTFIEHAGELEATAVFGVGAVGAMILAQPGRPTDRRHKLQRAIFNGLPAEKQLALEKRFGFRLIGEMYGHTEFVPIAASRADGPRARASGGFPLPDVEVRVVDEDDVPVPAGQIGEIVARPKRAGIMFDGYWNNPEATLDTWRNLWHHTGDYGRFDERGFIYFVDKKKEAIRRRGEFVTARELEGAILKHAGIAAVAVHGVPSELTEEEIKAWIVPEEGVALTPEDLFAFFNAELPYFAIPRFVELVQELPMNQSARVMKHELKARPHTEATWDLVLLGLVVGRDERRISGSSTALAR